LESDDDVAPAAAAVVSVLRNLLVTSLLDVDWLQCSCWLSGHVWCTTTKMWRMLSAARDVPCISADV